MEKILVNVIGWIAMLTAEVAKVGGDKFMFWACSVFAIFVFIWNILNPHNNNN